MSKDRIVSTLSILFRIKDSIKMKIIWFILELIAIVIVWLYVAETTIDGRFPYVHMNYPIRGLIMVGVIFLATFLAKHINI